jgi:hypothetical protein
MNKNVPAQELSEDCKNGGKCGVGGYCDDCHWPAIPSQDSTEIWNNCTLTRLAKDWSQDGGYFFPVAHDLAVLFDRYAKAKAVPKSELRDDADPIADTIALDLILAAPAQEFDCVRKDLLPHEIDIVMGVKKQTAQSQEPVAWMYEYDGMVHNEFNPPVFSSKRKSAFPEPWSETPLYLAPPDAAAQIAELKSRLHSLSLDWQVKFEQIAKLKEALNVADAGRNYANELLAKNSAKRCNANCNQGRSCDCVATMGEVGPEAIMPLAIADKECK